MSHNHQYKSLVVGLGRIGQELDYLLDNHVFQQTHATAYQHHPDFSLCGGIDVDEEKRRRFETRFGVPTFESVDEAMVSVGAEVVSIATPTTDHFSTFVSLLEYRVKGIVVEKPLAGLASEAAMMVELAEQHQICLVVNYVRRYEPGTNELHRLLRNGLIGKIYKGVVYYCKGIRNNGSHFIDLCSFLLGSPTSISRLTEGRIVCIGGSIDKEPDLLIEFDGVPVYFVALQHEFFSEASLRLTGSQGVVYYDGNGIRYNNIILQDEENIDRRLGNADHTIATDFEKYQFHVLSAFAGKLALPSRLTLPETEVARDILKLLETVDV